MIEPTPQTPRTPGKPGVAQTAARGTVGAASAAKASQPVRVVGTTQREAMIREAAYFHAEHRAFVPGNRRYGKGFGQQPKSAVHDLIVHGIARYPRFKTV